MAVHCVLCVTTRTSFAASLVQSVWQNFTFALPTARSSETFSSFSALWQFAVDLLTKFAQLLSKILISIIFLLLMLAFLIIFHCLQFTFIIVVLSRSVLVFMMVMMTVMATFKLSKALLLAVFVLLAVRYVSKSQDYKDRNQQQKSDVLTHLCKESLSLVC